MKVYSSNINVFGEDKVHIITADSKEEAKEMLLEFWFNDESLKIKYIEEVNKKDVLITKHN